MAIDMEACMRAATPGEAHQRLEQFAGTWKATAQHWMDPEGEPMTSTGLMKNTWVLGRRFLRQDYRGDSADHPFEGTGYFGFNNVTGSYEGMWIDSMSTGMSTDCGACDSGGQVWTMEGDMQDPASGAIMTKRSVVTVHDTDHHTMEMFFSGPDGHEFKAMQIDYTRAQ